MKFKNINSSFSLLDGRKIPCVGFGTCNVKDGLKGEDIVLDAIKCGYRHFDTASLYGSEKSVGLGIKNSGIAREEFFVTTKVWKDDLEPNKIKESFERSLKNLDMDYVDLLLIHWPRANAEDDKWEEHLKAAWDTYVELKQSGKVKSIGVSNFLSHHFDVIAHSPEKPVVDQIEFHPGYMQTGAVDYCHRHGIVVEAWTPLGRGKLIENLVVKSIAKKHKVSTAQVLLQFCLLNYVLPLVMSSKIERMKNNSEIFKFKLDDSDLRDLCAIEEKTAWSGEHPDLAIPHWKMGEV